MRERAAGGVRQGAVEHVQDGVVLPERKAERDRKYRRADDQSHAQLVYVGEEREASFVADGFRDHGLSSSDARLPLARGVTEPPASLRPRSLRARAVASVLRSPSSP